MNIFKEIEKHLWIIAASFVLIYGLVKLGLSIGIGKGGTITQDPVVVYPNGTTMVILGDDPFSYRGAVGVVSQKELLKRIGISANMGVVDVGK
jgi:hypothetical protein